MRSTQSLSITLPIEMARMVKAKVAAGEYASESEVIRDGLRTLQARDAVVEAWLRDEVIGTYDSHRSNPSRAIPAEEVLARLEQRFASRES